MDRSSSRPYAAFVDCQQAWNTTPANFDILANSPGYTAAQGGMFCRRITVGVAGTLVVTTAFNNVRTLTCVAGEILDLEAKYISGTSTAQNVKVYW